jgi:dipeptidyl aminopeptidase/acylaminoacyl peptidase
VIFNFGAWSRDGKQLGYAANARDSRFFDAYVMTLETGESRLVMQQDLTLDPVTFSPSGRNLIVSARESGFDNNLYLVDLEKPKAKPVLLTPHNGWATYDPVLWPVGPKTAKGFWVVSNLAAEFTKLGFLTVEKRELAYQDRGLWDVEQLAFSRNGVTMAYTLNLHGFSRIVVTDVATGKLQPPPRLPEGVLLDLAVSPKGDRLAFTYTNSRTPADVYISDVATGEVKRLTTSDLAGVPPDTFVEPKWILYPSADEKAIPAFVYLPPEARDDRKAPGLVVLHGGPESQERPVFRPLYQYFVRRGYALILPNVRGSSGYGKTYLHLDDTTKRLDSVRDVADLVAFLQKQYPQIDAKRLGAWGGSYGGWLALACLTEYPNLFAAGASVVGITNFETFLEQTGPWRRTHREAEYGRLDTDREWLRRISPIHRADRVQAPLLLIHGKNDPRVPLGEAEQIAKALRDRNQPVELLVYEDEGHGLRKLKNRLDAYPKLAAFFDRYLRAPSGMHQQ